MKPVLCLDFDGTLHAYTSGWQGAAIIPDEPVPGMLHFLEDALPHFRIAIHSSRSHHPGGVEAMKRWLRQYAPQHIVDAIEFPLVKPAAFLTLDDRALTFTGTWPSIEVLLNFKPWNK